MNKFEFNMRIINHNASVETGMTPIAFESFADHQMIMAIRFECGKKLSDARQNGRGGWWDKNQCDISLLYELRNRAIEENDHISTINFTGMIAMRESVLKKQKEPI